MGTILCATRGGQDSQHTQQAAIDLAGERGDRLVFLYVADVSFLNRIAAPVVVDVGAELERMGRFQLVMAQEQAADQGLEAEIELRHGQLRSELVAAARQLAATLIVLGRPHGEMAVFEEKDLLDFARDLRASTGIDVLVV